MRDQRRTESGTNGMAESFVSVALDDVACLALVSDDNLIL